MARLVVNISKIQEFQPHQNFGSNCKKMKNIQNYRKKKLDSNNAKHQANLDNLSYVNIFLS